MKNPWIAFFSQTGSEIVDIAESLGRWPDVIVTNERPEHLRTINPKLEGKVTFVPNKPTVDDYFSLTKSHIHPIMTLHGWLRVVPAEFIERYPSRIFNGHPGLITDYPELKGKDPQVRTWEGIQEGKFPTAGSVIHKVTAGVDEGEVKAFERFNTHSVESLDDLFNTLRDRSLYLWVNFLKGIVV